MYYDPNIFYKPEITKENNYYNCKLKYIKDGKDINLKIEENNKINRNKMFQHKLNALRAKKLKDSHFNNLLLYGVIMDKDKNIIFDLYRCEYKGPKEYYKRYKINNSEKINTRQLYYYYKKTNRIPKKKDIINRFHKYNYFKEIEAN